VAEQARQLEAFQRQEVARARAASAATTLPAPSVLQQQHPPPALTLQAQAPQMPAVTEAAQQLSLQPSAWGSGFHPPQPMPLSATTARGFSAYPQFAPEQQLQQRQQQQPQQQARAASPPLLALQWEGGSGGYDGAATPLQHQGATSGHHTFHGDSSGLAGAGRAVAALTQQQLLGGPASHHPTLRWDGGGDHSGLAAAAGRPGVAGGAAAQYGFGLNRHDLPPQQAGAGSDWNAPPQQPAAPERDAAGWAGAEFDLTASPPQRAMSYSHAHGGGGFDCNAPPLQHPAAAGSAPAQSGGGNGINAPPPQRAQPQESQDGIQQLQALMAALPQFAGLAARLNKVGACWHFPLTAAFTAWHFLTKPR